MQIKIRTLAREKINLDVSPNETVRNVKQMISDRAGISFDQIILIYGGKYLQDQRLDYYNIQPGSTLNMKLQLRGMKNDKLAKPLTDKTAERSHAEWQSKAEEFDFDEDLFIVDPSAHYHLLNQLEQSVVERSEYFREWRNLDLSTTLDVDSENQNIIQIMDDRLEIPAWLREKIIEILPAPLWQVWFPLLS